MFRVFLRLLSGLFLIAAIGFGLVWTERKAMPFNDEGRYFDPAQGVVYLEHSLPVYGILSVTFTLLALGSWLLARRR